MILSSSLDTADGAKGQLLEEMHTGSWVCGQMSDQYAFNLRADKLWKIAMNDLGEHFTVIAQIPEFVSLN